MPLRYARVDVSERPLPKVSTTTSAARSAEASNSTTSSAPPKGRPPSASGPATFRPLW